MVKKKLTVDDLGGMVQRGFEEVHREIGDIRSRMATKEDLKSLATKGDLWEVRDVLVQAIKDLEGRFVAATAYDREEIDRLKSWMEDIDTRLAALEGKRHKKA